MILVTIAERIDFLEGLANLAKREGRKRIAVTSGGARLELLR